MISKRTIGIVGTGHVGVAAAYALFLRGLAGEIVLVDKDVSRAEGEAMDLMHGQAFAESVNVTAGDYASLSDAQMVIIAAGVAQKPGESRLDLLTRNVEVLRSIIGQLDTHAPAAVLLIASNPVDILTYVTHCLTRRAGALVIGSGTMLDTARFRALLGRYYNVDPRSVHAYILGEHGDSEFPLWSSAQVGGISIAHSILGKTISDEDKRDLFEQVRHAAQEIISRKGYTNTAIGSSIARLAQAVLEDQRSVLPVSCLLEGQYDIDTVCLSIPAVVGRYGISEKLCPRLNDAELHSLRHSANVLKQSTVELPL